MGGGGGYARLSKVMYKYLHVICGIWSGNKIQGSMQQARKLHVYIHTVYCAYANKMQDQENSHSRTSHNIS